MDTAGQNQAAPSTFAAGARVRIVGLQAKPQFNGQEAKVIEWVEKRGRWLVEVDGANPTYRGIELGLRPANLEPIVIAAAVQQQEGAKNKKQHPAAAAAAA